MHRLKSKTTHCRDFQGLIHSLWWLLTNNRGKSTMLDNIIIKGFYVCKPFKFLTLNIYSEWYSFNIDHISVSSQHSWPSFIPTFPLASSRPPLASCLFKSWAPSVTGSFSTAHPFFNIPVFSSHQFIVSILSVLSQAAPRTQLYLFCTYQYNVNQHGLTSFGLVNLRCLWAQTALWSQMWLVNSTSKEDKSTSQYFIHQGNLQWITASLWLSLVLIYCFYSVFNHKRAPYEAFTM